MGNSNHRSFWPVRVVCIFAGLGLFSLVVCGQQNDKDVPADGKTDYATSVHPLITKYCLSCHSAKVKKGSLDLERFASLEQVRKDLKTWQQVIEMLQSGEMPPKKKLQPTAQERERLISWTRGFLDAEARARAGDPGHVPLRRLSNTEYDGTVHDLTGVDLRPTREFPADGAAGEGFTNAAEALSDISPTLLNKYLSAAKDIADHAVLLPDGFRFSPSKTRRDWTDESTAQLRQFFAAHVGGDGRLDIQPYLAAAVRHRTALLGGTVTPEDIAAKEKLNPKYFGILWHTLTDTTPSWLLDAIRARWRTATEKEVPALVGEIAAWQKALWKTVRIGSYIRPVGKGYAESTTRQLVSDPEAIQSVQLRLAVKPAPGQREVVLHFVAHELTPARGGNVVWHRPRFEAIGKPPLLLRDYNDFGPAFEVDYPSVFADCSKYLTAAVRAASDRKLNLDDLAKTQGLDAAFLKRWIEVLALEPLRKSNDRNVTRAVSLIPPNSVLGRWRKAAADPGRQNEAAQLARQVEAILSGAVTTPEKAPDRILYDTLAALDGPLFRGVNVARLAKLRPREAAFGLEKERLGSRINGKTADDASLVTGVDAVTEVRLPAALFAGREFVVEGRLDAPSEDRVVQFHVQTTPPEQNPRWDGTSPVVASVNGHGYRKLIQGYADFRRVFPLFLCFPQVVPTDEVVSLKMFHREDEPLERLFLDAEQKRRLNQLWAEHWFISRQPVAENNYLPQFIGFVTQDQPKEMLAYFESQRPVFQKRADEFLKEEQEAIPKQLDALLRFAARAYRRPLQEKEKTDLLALHKTVREKGAGHEEAFRGVLTRVLVSPAFLFRIEQAPAEEAPGIINDRELATRLSYFLWSRPPDDELRKLAALGQLRDPKVLATQVTRMLKDDRLRALAVEFGTQWIHVRDFDQFKEKNEKLFPTFDARLRKAIYEESILFFQDLFQSDRSVTQILDADYTFLNEALAKHYGIPGVTGPEWRRVEGVRKYGRGGVLGLASVQARQAGASRTSPVLRGNWVVETLLGEKLPRPPADVPRLPDEEGVGEVTMRQQVERHTKAPQCASCHVRIDPFGFALEKYDSIGRLRLKDLGGIEVDTKVQLKDGTEFEGMEGLRTYLLTKKKDVIVRLFCRRLLGYALGRSVALSDQPLIDEMVAELDKNDGRISSAVQVIVRSPQFRMIRGRDYRE